MTIIAAADGSALGNPGPAGWAWYVDERRWAAGGWPRGTNNQGELMAVIDLFEATAGVDDDLRVLCDSQYVINAVTKWMPGWKRKGWRKADGTPVLNLELLKRLDAAIIGRRYAFEWVKGHAGHELNEAADERARAAATAYQNRTAVPSGPGWPGERRGAGPVLSPVPSSVTDAGGGPDGGGDVGAVLGAEHALGAAATRGDAQAIMRLLHPAAEQVDASGRTHERAELARTLIQDAADPAMLDSIVLDSAVSDPTMPDSAGRLDADTMLVTFGGHAGGVAIRGVSVWVRVDGTWLLRFRQNTPLA